MMTVERRAYCLISSALGHASIKTTQNYLDGYTVQQINSYARLITQTINEKTE